MKINNLKTSSVKIQQLGIYTLSITLFLLNNIAISKNPSIVSYDNYVWFATDIGLYRYNKAQDSWDIFTKANRLLGDNIRDIGIDEGIIWVATNEGISNSDLRYNDWKTYTISDGIPSNDINCIAFSKDYVWIGTDKGVGRFDKVLEKWKSYSKLDGLSGDEVNDIITDAKLVWFATSEGISKLDISFDRWMSLEFNVTEPVKRIIDAGDYLWFTTDKELIRYNKKLSSWKSYTSADGIIGEEINNFIKDKDKLWLATKNGVKIYDLASDSWSATLSYNNMLPDKNVTDLAIDGNNIWFCTNKGVCSYNSETNAWKYYNSLYGLLDDSCKAIAVSGLIFVMTEKGINIYDKSTDFWDKYEFSSLLAGRLKKGKFLKIDDNGLGIDIRETKLRLSGTNSLEFIDNNEFGNKQKNTYNWYVKSDLNLKGDLPKQRSIIGYYNNINEDNIEYEMNYRGNNDDILQKIVAGKFQARMRNSNIIEDTNLEGTGALIRFRSDEVFLNLEPRFGEQKGYFETDFFIYDSQMSIYQLSHKDIIADTEIVMVNDELIQRGADYILIYTTGMLMFLKEEVIDEGAIIEVRYQYRDRESDNKLFLATSGIDYGNNLYAGVDVVRNEQFNNISLNGEVKDIKIGNIDIKLNPELAYSRHSINNDVINGMGSSVNLIANTKRTQLKFDHETYGKDFITLNKRKTTFGRLSDYRDIFARYEITNWMPFTFRYKQDKSDDGSIYTLERNLKASLFVSKPNFPKLILSGTNDTIDSPRKEQKNLSGRVDLQYNIPFKNAEIASYFRVANQNGFKNQTIFTKIKLDPIDKFSINGSYKLNKQTDNEKSSINYSRILINSNFSSIRGIINNTRFESYENSERSTTSFVSALSLIPGMWINSLNFLTFSGIFNASDQSFSNVEGTTRNRSLRLQTGIRPSNVLSLVGTYDAIRNKKDILSFTNRNKYRTELEYIPNIKTRITLEYYQDNREEKLLRDSTYSPALSYEYNWSTNWNTRIRCNYQYYESNEMDRTVKTKTMLGISLRYMNRKLPNKRIYITQSNSLSYDQYKQGNKDESSVTYSPSLGMEWKFSENLSFRSRINFSYTNGNSNKGLINIYLRLLINL